MPYSTYQELQHT